MSTTNGGNYFRAWMDLQRFDPNTNNVTLEYAQGIHQFMAFASNQPVTLESKKMFCPCPICSNNRFLEVSVVWRHLFRNGIMPSYKFWYVHGETKSLPNIPYITVSADDHSSGGDGIAEEIQNPMVEMVHDRYQECVSENLNVDNHGDSHLLRALGGATQPLYDGCRDDLTSLLAATMLMNIKTDYNLPEECVDRIAWWGKLLCSEQNNMFETYYDIQKLVAGLGLPYETIDVCVNNCLIFWGEYADIQCCCFCGESRYQASSTRSRVPKKKMWFLPVADRLKRLLMSERTAKGMRWHAKHNSVGEIRHPSDVKAWKHFQTTFPEFASERRNVYLGLSTDGFNPFGRHGRQYSLWPVIVTPYNLPPQLCMKKEFLFLTILIPGPEHPKKSLDVFLQPLIKELKTLWETGVSAFDVSSNENFSMRAVLMWTISDFPACGMLSS